MNVNEIQDLIKFVAKAGVNEVEIEKKDFKIVIKSDYMAKKKTNFKENFKNIPSFFQNQISKIIKSFLYLFIFFAWGIILLSTAQNFI